MEVPIGASEIVHSGSSCRFSSGSEMHGNFLAISELDRLGDPGSKELIHLNGPFIVLSSMPPNLVHIEKIYGATAL